MPMPVLSVARRCDTHAQHQWQELAVATTGTREYQRCYNMHMQPAIINLQPDGGSTFRM